LNRLTPSLLSFALVSLLGVSGASAMQAATPKVAAPTGIGKVELQHEVFTLPNGLTVVVHTDHSVPNVFVGVWYRVGSKDEPEGKTGFAHLFEHLMFQETRNRKGEYFLSLDKAGASDMNGTTDVDQTRYYQTVPSNALDLALWMESDRMAYLGRSITQAGLDEQRAVVKNEKRQGELGEQDPTADMHRQNYYPVGHPYRHTTIGSMDDLDKATLEDVRAWFAQYYGASNAVLVLSGDIDVATARTKAAHYFADAPAGRPASRMDQWLPSFTDIKRDIVQSKGPVGAIRRSWPVSNDDRRQLAYLQLAAGTLAGSSDTVLWDLLVDRLQLASSVSASVSSNLLTSTFGLAVVLKPGVSPAQVNPILDRALADYFAKGPTDTARIQAIVTGTENSLLRSLESNAAVGAMLAQGELYESEPAGALDQLEWVRAATPEDLRTAAKRWLQRPYYEIVTRPATPLAAPTDTVDRSAAPVPGPFHDKVKFPAIETATLSNGMKLVVANRPGLPLIDASVQFDTGKDAEDGYGEGMAEQAIKLLAAGTARRDANGVSKEVARIGFYMNAAVADRGMGFSWSTTSNRLQDSFALASELLRTPAYPQSEIDRLRANVNVDAAYDAYERNPINATEQVFAAALWGPGHRNGRITDRAKAREDFARLDNRDAVVRFHDTELGPSNATLYVMGDVTLAQARQMGEQYFGSWRRNHPTPLPDPTREAPAAQHAGRIILIDAPGVPQSSIIAGHLVAPFDPDTAATDALMNAALGGSFHSRLNMNLREEKGWTYGFSAGISDDSRGPRVFTASGTVETEHTAQALVEIRKEIGDYVGDRPIAADELERDRDAAVKAIPSSFTSNGAFLASMISAHAMGQPYNHAEGAMQRLSAVDLEQVRTRARQTYHPDQMTWVVAGDLKRIEADIRALGLGPVEVWDVYGNKVR
jgi:zinc protease